MQKIINFFRGSVLFTVTGAFPERFLNLCAQAGAAFWDLEWLDEHTLRLRVVRKDARRLGKLAEKVMCEAKAERRAGIPFFLAQFRKRYALVAGFILAVAAVCVLSQFILTIEITGNQNVSTSAILTELSRVGVRVGAYGPGLDVRGASHQILLRMEDLSWMTVNLHGTRAEVIVREKLVSPPVLDETTPSQVVADATGIITHMEVLEGQPLFQEGDTVLAGEVVISGVMDLKEPKYSEIDAGTRRVHAHGNIWARTWRTMTAEIPLTAQVKSYSGEEHSRLALVALGHRVELWGSEELEQCDKRVEVASATLPGGRLMPLSLVRERYRSYVTVPVSLDIVAAQELLEASLLEQLNALVGEDGEVLRTDFAAWEQDGVLKVSLQAECSEQIGRVIPLEGKVGPDQPPTRPEEKPS